MTSLDPYSYNELTKMTQDITSYRGFGRTVEPFNQYEDYHTDRCSYAIDGYQYLYLVKCSGGHYKIGMSNRHFYFHGYNAQGNNEYYRSHTYTGASRIVDSNFWNFPLRVSLRTREKHFIRLIKSLGGKFYGASEDFEFSGNIKYLIRELDRKHKEAIDKLL